MFSFPLQWFPSPSAARLFSIVLLIWFAAELTNMVIGRRGLMRSGRKDRGSFWVIIIAVYVCFTIPFIARGADLWVITGGLQYAGIALVLVGIALREWSILVLGRYFSVVVRIESDHHLIHGRTVSLAAASVLYRHVDHDRRVRPGAGVGDRSRAGSCSLPGRVFLSRSG